MKLMELLGVVLLWPLLLLVIGVVFISAADVVNGFLAFPLVIFLFIVLFGLGKHLGGVSEGTSGSDLDRTRAAPWRSRLLSSSPYL